MTNRYFEKWICRTTRSVFFDITLLVLVFSMFSSVCGAGPKVGDKFGDWTFACRAFGPGLTKCELAQDIRLKKGGKRVLQLSLGYVGQANVLALVIKTPLNSHLPSGVLLNIDSGSQKLVAFQQCKMDGCLALAKISKEFHKELAHGRKLSAQYKLVLKKGVLKVPVSVSLRGTRDGILALEDGMPSHLDGEAQGQDKFPIF